MNNKECKICKEAIKHKYRFFVLWKVLAIVFICLTILFATLYFASGDVFKSTTNNNDVEIVNEGDGDNNNNVIINN